MGILTEDMRRVLDEQQLGFVKVDHAEPLWSPAYDQGRTEAEVTAVWEQSATTCGAGARGPASAP